MCSNNENKIETTTEESTGKKFDPSVCGFCGSTSAPVSYATMYGTTEGDDGWDRCPDCGGV